MHGKDEFKHLDSPSLPVSPDWSPVNVYDGCHHSHAQTSMPRKAGTDSHFNYPHAHKWVYGMS